MVLSCCSATVRADSPDRWLVRRDKERDPLVLEALDMAFWQRDWDGIPQSQDELRLHADAGSQGGFNRSSQHSQWWECDGQAGRVNEGVDAQFKLDTGVAVYFADPHSS